MNDLHNGLVYEKGYAPVAAAVADNTAMATGIIDTQGYTELEFVILTGTLEDANATFAVTLEHGDDSGLSDTAAPAAAQLVGTTTDASFTYAADGVTKKIGYICGAKRYVRLTVTPSANTGNAPLAILVVKRPRHTS